MAGALQDFTVIDLTSGHAGALCSLFLSDHGARVLRVIDQDAPALRDGGFVIWDRGKECIRLELDAIGEPANALHPAREAFTNLVRGADVLLEDYAPSAPRRRLVEESWLRAVNPRLVNGSITAYGHTGPWKDEPPIDDLVLARMGILGGMPGFRPPPVHVVHPLPSVGAATLAALGIAAALYARETTGWGRSVATSLMAGALLYHPKVTGEKLAPQEFQTHPSGSAPFYSVYQCADGNWVQLGCVHAGFINIAGEVMGITQTLAEPRFGAGRTPQTPAADAELRAILTQVIAQKTLSQWAALFETADVPFAPAQWTEESLDDPQVQHNNMVVTLNDPQLGPIKQMGVGLKLTQTPGAVAGPRQQPTLPLNEIPADWPPDRQATPTATASTPFDAPLDGTRILEITNLIAGPTTGRLLADLGADVVKFEPLTGDMSRPIGRGYFYSVNFNKRSVSVDTRTDDGKTVAQRMAAASDALVANLRPHATERMGITPAVNPSLIETHLTGYGWTGPYSRRPGIDPMAQAFMGLERAQGGPDNPPVFPAQLAPTDFTTGAVGALGTVLGLLTRKRTGIVQRAESNLLNGGILLTSQWFSEHLAREPRPLADRNQYGLNPFHRLYSLADGWIYVAADQPQEQEALCHLFGQRPPTAERAPHPNETPFATALAARLEQETVADCLEKLAKARVPAAPALPADSEVFLRGEQASAAGVVADRQHPTAGLIRVAWRYITFGNTHDSAGLATPLLGEHTEAVLSEVGFGATDIKRLFAHGIVKTETT